MESVGTHCHLVKHLQPEQSLPFVSHRTLTCYRAVLKYVLLKISIFINLNLLCTSLLYIKLCFSHQSTILRKHFSTFCQEIQVKFNKLFKKGQFIQNEKFHHFLTLVLVPCGILLVRVTPEEILYQQDVGNTVKSRLSVLIKDKHITKAPHKDQVTEGLHKVHKC